MSLLWIVCIALSAIPLVVPLLDFHYFDNFYGRSGVCLALHITQERPNGWEYSVFVFLVLNFLSFTTIAIAYLWMFFVAKNTTNAVRTPEHKIHNRMARRMMFIVMTDFWCWMPIILLGIISFYGVKIPPQVSPLFGDRSSDQSSRVMAGVRMGGGVCVASERGGQPNAIYVVDSGLSQVEYTDDSVAEPELQSSPKLQSQP